MEAEALSNAQSLRVIGQGLAGLGINYFQVDKVGDEYIVQLKQTEITGNSANGIFPKSFVKMPRAAHDDSSRQMPLCFNTSQIIWSNTANQLRRGQSSAMPDVHDLATLLRVLGDYLDRKAADDFTISCDMRSVRVSYGEQNETFQIAHLYDFGVYMYLRRSNRGGVP